MSMLTGRKIVVTGGFGVLGAAVARAARAAGAVVATVDFAPAAEASPLAFGGVDLADSQGAASVLASIAGDQGIDGLVNVAGGFRWQTLADGPLASWDDLFRMNVLSAVHASKAALPYLAASPHGRIVNIGAAAAAKAASGMGPYAAAKSAVAKLTESLAEELAGTPVTVNAVLPTIIDTPANRGDMPDADFGAWVTPDDLADVIIFLLSDKARAVSGALIPVGKGRGAGS